MRRPLILAAVASLAVAIPQEAPPVRILTPDLEIGGADEGRDEYIFSLISGVAFDPTGRIVVVDLRENNGRVYRADGRYQYRFGGEGQGPGDFGAALSGVFGPDGLFWVRDDENARISAFELGPQRATFMTSVKVETKRPPTRLAAVSFDPAGRIFSPASYRDTLTGHTIPYRNLYDKSGRLVGGDTVRMPKGVSIGNGSVTKAQKPNPNAKPDEPQVVSATFFYYQPFGAGLEVAYAPNGEYARAVTSRYDIEWRDASGKVLRNIRRDVTGPALSIRERTSANKTVNEFLTRARISASELKHGVPDRKAPIVEIAFDQLGRLWVERSVPDQAPREADLYDRTGKWIAILRWPKDVNPMASIIGARGDQVLAIARDSLGVQWVKRLTMK